MILLGGEFRKWLSPDLEEDVKPELLRTNCLQLDASQEVCEGASRCKWMGEQGGE